MFAKGFFGWAYFGGWGGGGVLLKQILYLNIGWARQ